MNYSGQTKSADRLRSGAAKSKVAPRPVSASAHPGMQLQRTLGNQGAQRLLRAGVIQLKLKISRSSDRFEQEAERVADQVDARRRNEDTNALAGWPSDWNPSESQAV